MSRNGAKEAKIAGVTRPPTSYRYTGQRQEAGIGLYFYGARWYDPALGRFTSPDSIIPAQQGVQGWDRYAYVNNNPINYTDPTGHTKCAPNSNNCTWQVTMSVEQSQDFRRLLGDLSNKVAQEGIYGTMVIGSTATVYAIMLATLGGPPGIVAGAVVEVIGLVGAGVVEADALNESNNLDALADDIGILINEYGQGELSITYDSENSVIQVCGTTDGGCVSYEFGWDKTIDGLEDWLSDAYGDPNSDASLNGDEDSSDPPSQNPQ